MKNLFVSVFLFVGMGIFCGVLEDVDGYDFSGRYTETYNILKGELAKKPADIETAWRFGRATFECAELVKDNKEKIKYYEEAVKVATPFLDNATASGSDRAELIHWYTINYASKIKYLGLFGGEESLKIAPKVFKYMDMCMTADKEYPGSYFFLGKFQSELPHFLGGDKEKMEINFNKALYYCKLNGKSAVLFMSEAAASFYKRNWSMEKKKSLFKKISAEDLKYIDKTRSDNEIVLSLLAQIRTDYQAMVNPSERDKRGYNQSLLLAAKVAKER